MIRNIKRLLLTLVIIFLVAFPKGGFKVSGIPLTWGYLLLMLSLPFTFSGLFHNQRLYFTKARVMVLGLCLPFILYTSALLAFGSYASLGFLFSFILSLLLMPIIFMLFSGKVIDHWAFREVFNPIFINSLRFVTIFGLILFLLKILTGASLEIPYLTVNIDDIGNLDEKYNLRGDIMKYTSTYNNGNIFGICMLILSPIYLHLEKKKIFKIIFLISLSLTLSRTVWFGMALLGGFYVLKNIKNTKGLIILLLSLIGVTVFLPLLLKLIGMDMGFLFDKNLGGRINQLSIIDSANLFGDGQFDGIAEIVYTSILQHFGIIGLLLFFLYLFSPLIVYYMTKGKLINNNYHWGLILYPILCVSDGAMLFIPTMAFFWFLGSFIFANRVLSHKTN